LLWIGEAVIQIEDMMKALNTAVAEAIKGERERLIRELTSQGVIWKDDEGRWTHVQPVPDTARQIPYTLKTIQNID
jgi:hypothetical protein